MPSSTTPAVACIVAVLLAQGWHRRARAEEQPAMVAQRLQAFLDGELPPEQLAITYTDMHGLLGGLTMTVHGNGRVEQQTVRRPAPQPRALTPEGVRRLVELLVKKEAWQKAPPRTRPDPPGEVYATLKIQAGDAASSISERVRDMKQQNRILPIMLLMQELAWPQEEPKQ